MLQASLPDSACCIGTDLVRLMGDTGAWLKLSKNQRVMDHQNLDIHVH